MRRKSFLLVKLDWDGPKWMGYHTAQRIPWPFRRDGTVNPAYSWYVREREGEEEFLASPYITRREFEVGFALEASLVDYHYVRECVADPRRDPPVAARRVLPVRGESFPQFFHRFLGELMCSVDTAAPSLLGEHERALELPRTADDGDEPPLRLS